MSPPRRSRRCKRPDAFKRRRVAAVVREEAERPVRPVLVVVLAVEADDVFDGGA
jgi:hypothetical protein